MSKVRIIEWNGYGAGAITPDSVDTKEVDHTGSIIVTATDGSKYNVHPLAYSYYNNDNECVDTVGGAYPIRWQVVAAWTSGANVSTK